MDATIVQLWQSFLANSFNWGLVMTLILSLEFTGAWTGVWDVWLCATENIWNFPVGILNITIFFFMFWQAQLYASSILQVFFLILTFWGWWVWLHGDKNTKEVKVTRNINLTESLLTVAFVLVGTIGFGKYLATTGDPHYYADAFVSILSVAAMYFMSKKVLHCWWMWITVDVVSIPLYTSSVGHITGGLYCLFLCMCIKGLYDWKNEPAYKKLSAGQVPAAS